MRRGIIIGSIILASLAGGAASATPTWGRALTILDDAGPDAAAAYLTPFLQQHPERLDLLDAWTSLEERRAPADSLAARVAAALPDALPTPAGLFLDALARNDAAAFAAAAAAAPDSIAAAIVTVRGMRAAVAAAARPTVDHARRRFASLLDGVAAPPRLSDEVTLLFADLAYLSDQLALTDSLLVPLVASARFPAITARALNTLGGVAAKQRRLEDADRLYSEAERLARPLGDPRMLVTVLANQGYQATTKRDFDTADTCLAEAEALAARYGLHGLRGAIRASQGAAAEMAGQRRRAVTLYREAVDLAVAQHAFMSEVGSRQRLAYCLSVMGEYAEARAEYRTCLRLLDEHQSQFVRNWVLAGLALMEHKLGRLDRAVALYREARELNLALGDHLSAAWCLNSLGVIQTLRGQYRQALLTGHEVLRQYALAGDREGVGEAHATLAEVYLELGDLAQAREHGQRAFALADSTSSQELLLRALRDLAAAHPGAAPAAETAALYRQAIAIAHEWDDRVVEARLWNDLAAHHLAHADTAAAVADLDRSTVCLPAGPHYEVRARTGLLRGRSAPTADLAVGWARQALAEAEAAGLPGLEWEAHSDLGWYLHLVGDRAAGRRHQEQAVALVEGLRWQVGTDELRRHMLRTANLPFERLVSQLMADAGPGHAAAALAASERARAQILAGRLRASLASAPDTTATVPDPHAVALAYLQSRLQDGGLTTSERDSLRAQVQVVEQAASLQRLAAASPGRRRPRMRHPLPPSLWTASTPSPTCWAPIGHSSSRCRRTRCGPTCCPAGGASRPRSSASSTCRPRPCPTTSWRPRAPSCTGCSSNLPWATWPRAPASSWCPTACCTACRSCIWVSTSRWWPVTRCAGCRRCARWATCAMAGPSERPRRARCWRWAPAAARRAGATRSATSPSRCWPTPRTRPACSPTSSTRPWCWWATRPPSPWCARSWPTRG